jgi:YD repeat-containing protein
VFDYGYDLAGRLETVTANGAPARAYAYDANGNRLSVIDHAQVGAITSGVYDAQDRLLSYGTSTYTYNAAGDLTSKTDLALPPGQQTTAYVYDALGNWFQWGSRTAEPSSTCSIDGQNRRVGNKVNGVLVQGWLYREFRGDREPGRRAVS